MKPSLVNSWWLSNKTTFLIRTAKQLCLWLLPACIPLLLVFCYLKLNFSEGWLSFTSRVHWRRLCCTSRQTITDKWAIDPWHLCHTTLFLKCFAFFLQSSLQRPCILSLQVVRLIPNLHKREAFKKLSGQYWQIWRFPWNPGCDCWRLVQSSATWTQEQLWECPAMLLSCNISVSLHHYGILTSL